MIRAKEIYNDINGQEFISKKFLRDQAIDYLNYQALELAKEVRDGKTIEEDSFHSVAGLAYGYAYLGVLTSNEVNIFMDGVIYAKHLEAPHRAMMATCGETFILELE